jgi:propanol-preferring alcohol dehydrogenase
LVINAIRKERSDQSLLGLMSYEDHLWLEKELKSVANITRKDIAEFLPIAARIPIRVETETYALEDANEALRDLRAGHVRGAKVLQIKK